MNYIKLIRPLNLIIIIATMYMFRYTLVAAAPYRTFYITNVLSEIQFLFLVLATVFIAAGGYVINDIFDVDIDIVNRPTKVLIGDKISETQAYNLYKILCVLGILFTLILAYTTRNFRLSTLPIIIMVILNFYAHTFKKQLIVGNFMISLCASFTILLIGLFESSSSQGSSNDFYIRSGIAIAAVMYSLFAFLTTFLREIIKDMEDQKGDELYGARTIPIVFGAKGAKIFAYAICFILLVLFTSLIWFFPSINIKNVAIFIAIGLVLPLLVIIFFIIKSETTANYHFVSNLIKFFMCIGIGTMLYFTSGIGPYIFVQYANFIKKLF